MLVSEWSGGRQIESGIGIIQTRMEATFFDRFYVLVLAGTPGV